MHKIKSIHQQASLNFLKICISCFGIAGTAIVASGVLKLGVLNNDRKIEQISRALRPVSDGLTHLVENSIF